MKRNPVNILNDTISKATELASFALRTAIISKRVKRFKAIDLRHYRGQPEKKEKIKKIINNLIAVQCGLTINMMVIISQPIQMYTFSPGTGQAQSGENKEAIINRK